MVSRNRTLGRLIACGRFFLLAAILAFLLLRDRPRRMIEETISARIGARVRIGRLIPTGLESWRLDRIRIDEPPAWPWIDALTIESLAAEGALRDVLAGRFRQVTVHGVEIRIQTAEHPPALLPPSALTIGHLTVEEGTISGQPRYRYTPSPVAFSADLFAIGTTPHGTARLHAPSFEPRAWFQLLELRFVHSMPPGYPPRDFKPSCSPEPAHADLVLEPGDDGSLRIEVAAGLPWTQQARLTLQRKDELTTQLSLAIDGIDPLCWLPPIENLAYTGTVAIAADRRDATAPMTLRLTGQLADLSWQDARAETDLHGDSLRLSIGTTMPPRDTTTGNASAAADVHNSVVARASLTGLRGRLAGNALPGSPDSDQASPIDVSHVEATLDGLLHIQDQLSVGGTWTAKLGTFATLRAEGELWREAGLTWPVASLSWSLEDIDTGPVVAWLSDRLPGIAIGLDELRVEGRFEDGLNRPNVHGTVITEHPIFNATNGLWRLRTERLTTQVRLTPDVDRHAIEFDKATWWVESQGIEGQGLTLTGDLSAQLEIAAEAGELGIRGSIALENGGFQSAEGARAAEGLTASAQISAQPDHGGGHRLQINGDLTGPALLWETLFADFSAIPVAFVGELHVGALRAGAGHTDGYRPWTLAASATPTLENGDVRLIFEARNPRGSSAEIDVELQVSDLSTAYEALIRRPFAGSSPRIEGLRLGGRADAKIAITRTSSGQRLAGKLVLERAHFATAAQTLTVEDFNLDLPFDWVRPTAATLERSSDTSPSADAKPGRLAFGRLTVAGVGFANVDTPLSVSGDSIRLAKPLTTGVAGGTVTFQDLAFRHLTTADRELATAISLRALDLDRLTRALDLPPLAGRLDGEVPRIRLRAPRFEVEGEASLDLFGGTVRLFDIAGRDLFSPFPRLTFSADFGDLDLALLTAAFEVGRMAGRVEGTIRHCTLVRAQPVACAAQIESQTGPGIPRWIDLEAVNNLAVLGTGGGLQQGLARRFLRRFTYDKLGLSVRLADDRFLLRGLVHKRNKEYFLKGRLPFPIDIVNAAPGSSVSFEIMLDRIRNLEQARLTRGHSQPEDRP